LKELENSFSLTIWSNAMNEHAPPNRCESLDVSLLLEDRERIFLGQSGIFIFRRGGKVGRANFPSSCLQARVPKSEAYKGGKRFSETVGSPKIPPLPDQ